MLSRKAHRWTANFCTAERTPLYGNTGRDAFGTSCSFVSFRSLGISKEQCSLWGREWEFLNGKARRLQIGREARTVPSSSSLLSSVSTFPLAPMGIRHSSRCMLLRRKMAESESSEVSVRHLDTFWFTKFKWDCPVRHTRPAALVA